MADAGVLPGWSALPDAGGTLEDEARQYGQRLSSYPWQPAIVYRQADHGTGPFHTLANLTQTKPSGEHPEGYGLFYGARHWTAPVSNTSTFWCGVTVNT